MTPAGKLQKYLREQVERRGGCYRKAQWEGRLGCPDCFVWFTWPNVAWIEIKATNGNYKDRLRVVQAREVERMREAGLPVFVASSEADIDNILETLL